MAEPEVEQDIKTFREWRDEHADAKLRRRAMPSGEAFLWDGIDLLLRELDRRIDPDDLDDDQSAIYEAGYIAGQTFVAGELHKFAKRIERTNDDLGAEWVDVTDHVIGEPTITPGREG